MKYIYGPINSRRLGCSLGISLTPYKICSFDCVYCQLGKTKEKTSQRRVYAAVSDIFAELQAWFTNNPEPARKLDYLTIAGAGEPTLHSEISVLIDKIKSFTPIPMALITNASLFIDPAVRRAVSASGIIVPSLDAVDEEVFKRIDRPQENIMAADIISGLVHLRKEYKGKIWLEVMLVSGLNDDIRYIRKLKEAVDLINPDKIQLNSPVRATAEANIFAVDKKKLEKIKEIIGEKCEII